MNDRLGDFARLNHILETVLEIEIYTADVSFEDFCNN